MPYLNPDVMTAAERSRVGRWLDANGCRDWIALEPVVLRGRVAEYTAAGHKDAPTHTRRAFRLAGERSRLGHLVRRPAPGAAIVTRRRRLTIRIPLSAIA